MIGKTISHYMILEKLGEGGMGVVYKALDTKLNRTVALKFLPAKALQSEEEKRRIVREAQAAAVLNHPNIATVHEINEINDQSFIVMEYIEGSGLEKRIAKGSLKIDGVLDLVIQIGEGIQAAHENGIVHRDIKPNNVMVTETGRVKLMDFGLVKMRDVSLLTKEGTTLGTVPYMSPEQAMGEEVDHRTDLWSLGVLLYEMIAGQRPFKSDYEQALIYLIINEDPEPLRKHVPDISLELVRIIDRLLEKNKENRYPSATELLNDLKKYRDSSRQEELGVLNARAVLHRLRRPQIAIPTIAAILVIVLVTGWFFNKQANIRWAREEALPQIEQLIRNWQFTDAYKLAEQAEMYIPRDPMLAMLIPMCSFNIDIDTEPPGANIYIKEYHFPESEWNYLGVSPIEGIRLPVGIFRWKIEKEGYETVMAAASTWDIQIGSENTFAPNHFMRVLDEIESVPPGMTRVAGAQTPLVTLDDFFIDRYEVTNRRYKDFIDNGGYRSREYWKYEFIKDGRILSREEAMGEFVDQSGRPGPSTWLAGHYLEGEGDHPVSGISWYEAAAYAEFAGKRLPTVHHWGLARGEQSSLIRWPQIAGFATFAPYSNFGEGGPVPVGSLHGITSYGAYDMAGNVREWCWNETDMGRILRGGSWIDPPYMFGARSQAPPFDRSSTNGFRCALYPEVDEIPEQAFAKATFRELIDFYQEEPVSDQIFQVYKDQFSYDRTALNTHVEWRDESSDEWIQEKVTFNAAYGNERIIAHLFLPKNIEPPFQTVVYFPGSSAVFGNSSEDLAGFFEFPVFVDFLIKNGRAVLFPVYKGTFERKDGATAPIHGGHDSYQFTEYLSYLVKDFRRSIDFLETRQDIDVNRIAYYGMSWGGGLGAIIPAVEDRLSANIILSGGFTGRGRPEANQINYVTRVMIPTLMMNGMYDSIFPYETSIKPMFDLLGTPEKQLKVYETDHIPPRNEFIKETLNWLDQHLGPVK
jgi:eukaryotic-like serine/threonine-protein kinase